MKRKPLNLIHVFHSEAFPDEWSWEIEICNNYATIAARIVPGPGYSYRTIGGALTAARRMAKRLGIQIEE